MQNHECHWTAKSLPLEKDEDLHDTNGRQQRWLLVSHEDYELMAEQLAEYGHLMERQFDSA